MIDKCLDIAEVNWKGYNISFLSKPGLTGRNHYDTHGAEAQRSIMGGMLFTCGLENILCTVFGRWGKNIQCMEECGQHRLNMLAQIHIGQTVMSLNI